MAQRRMFSKTITNSSQFLMMPSSSQSLYFHLGMNADDDGFCEHFTVMRMTDSKPDDLRILQAKSFVHVFDEKVLVITNWKENNFIRSDRYTPSKYLTIYGSEMLRLSSGIPTGDPGKVRICKEREEKPVKQSKRGTDSEIESILSTVPSDSLREIVKEWMESRKQLKKPVTSVALKRALGQLELWYPGDDAKKIATVERSIINGWTGIFPLKPNKQQDNHSVSLSDFMKMTPEEQEKARRENRAV